ncbi:MAG: molybdopterin-dependent oxidoreductase [Chitinophagaceae bacterium]|nr:molybdopterin-dependent oxidoreductase [Chitinophagaceae bacterium]
MANIFKTIFTSNKKLNIDQQIMKKTVVSFFFFFVFAGAAFWGWKWLRKQPMEPGSEKNRTSAVLRKVLNTNEDIFKGLLSKNNLAKEYPRSKAANPARVNGYLGLKTKLDSNWAMNVIKANGDTLKIKLDDIKKLPKIEFAFNFKCIEGWSQVTHWGGVKFSDFVKAYGLGTESAMNYLGLATPDKQYYVGIDMPSALHPQTILCYELNGMTLPMDQGYPLRLIIPVKYGVKSLKRIGYMYFDNKRTPDYWADVRGYDYYTGL